MSALRQTPVTEDPHEALCRAVAANYEERHNELLEENGLLRHALYATQRDLVEMLNHEHAFKTAMESEKR